MHVADNPMDPAYLISGEGVCIGGTSSSFLLAIDKVSRRRAGEKGMRISRNGDEWGEGGEDR